MAQTKDVLMPRPLLNGLAACAILLALLTVLRATWSPDPTQNLFFRAQHLQEAGQTERALRAYALISDQHPDSFYAPRALLAQGDLLAANGTRSGEKGALRAAVAAYARLAKTYPRDALVTDALENAGRIALENLHDLSGARGFYTLLLDKGSSRGDEAALATLQLGRIALDEGDRERSQELLQRVLQGWPNLPERGAQAQFTLGVLYETLFQNTGWATRAYNATIERYPNSTWANDARQKLGLLVYGQRKPPARRVLIQIEPLPDDGKSDGSLWSALRLLLAARGVEASENTLGGWSLLPFYAGFDPANPARVVQIPVDGWENVVANAGLRFSVQSGGKNEAEALRQLQDEINAARAPLVYYEEKGAKVWALCVGYDSERAEVMLQSRGARFDTLSAKSFAANWKAKSRFGQPWTLISLVPADQKTRPKPSLTPTPMPTPAPGATPAAANAVASQYSAPDLQSAPAFVWELPTVSLSQGDARARQRAATILGRGRSGEVLLGAAGLERLASELTRIAQARPVAAVEVAPLPEPTAIPAETPLSPVPEPESAYAPDATPTPVPTPVPMPELRRTPLRDDAGRARALLGFLGAPVERWAQNRREAAAWCDEASKRSKDVSWQRARDALRQSADALEAAVALAPAEISSPLRSGDRAQIAEAARQILRARDAERAAARALGG